MDSNRSGRLAIKVGVNTRVTRVNGCSDTRCDMFPAASRLNRRVNRRLKQTKCNVASSTTENRVHVPVETTLTRTNERVALRLQTVASGSNGTTARAHLQLWPGMFALLQPLAAASAPFRPGGLHNDNNKRLVAFVKKYFNSRFALYFCYSV